MESGTFGAFDEWTYCTPARERKIEIHRSLKMNFKGSSHF